MASYQPSEDQAQSKPEPQPRKIGYVTERLEEVQAAPKTEEKPKVQLITDWASI